MPLREWRCHDGHVTERLVWGEPLAIIGCATCGRVAVRMPSVCHAARGNPRARTSWASQAVDRVRQAIREGRA